MIEDIENNLGYAKKLKSFARELRRKSTNSEITLWNYVLKSRKMKGYTFNRQRPVLNYIADFMCKKLKLIIELDGYTHIGDDANGKDLKRQKDLEDAGFTVLRFIDYDVLKNIDGVNEIIKKEIEKIEKERVVLPLNPPPKGEVDIREINCR